MSRFAELQQRRNTLAEEIRDLGDKFEKNGKKWNKGEAGQWAKANAAYEDVMREMGVAESDAQSATVAARVAEVDRRQLAVAEDFARLGLPDAYNGMQGGRALPGRDQPNAAPVNGDRPMFVDVANGKKIPVIRKNDSFYSALRARNGEAGPIDDLSPGQVLRALAVGASNSLEARALAEGVDTSGGYNVPEVLSARLVDRTREELATGQAGISMISLDSERNAFTKLVTDPTPVWRPENVAITESEPTFGRVVFEPKTIGVLVKASQELIEDSVNIGVALETSIAAALAEELDRAILFGNGATEPLGLFNMPGVQSVSMGDNGAAITDYTPFLDAIEDLQVANAKDPQASIMAPRTLRVINGLTATDNQPLQRPPALTNMRFLRSNKVPIDQTQGTADNASSILLGDWPELVVGVRTRLRIEVLKERFRENLQIGYLAFMRMDVAAWHTESFAKIVGVIPE